MLFPTSWAPFRISACVEVYQPRDDLSRTAYAAGAARCRRASGPASRLRGRTLLVVEPRRSVPACGEPAAQTHSIMADRARRIGAGACVGGEIEATFRDDDAGIACEVRLSAIAPWDDSGQAPYRQTVSSWGEMWSMLDHAASVASRLESKGNRRQAVSRLADQLCELLTAQP